MDEADDLSILDGLDEEEAFIHRDDEKLLDEARQMATVASETTPLIQLDRSNLRSLMNNQNLPPFKRVALRWFLGRFKQSRWMQWQHHGLYPERIGIALSASWHKSKDFAYCNYAGRLCGECDHCLRCAFLKKAKRALKEYENVYDRTSPEGGRLYFYAVSPSFEFRASSAGLHFVVRKENRQRNIPAKIEQWNPCDGLGDVEPLTGDDDVGRTNPVVSCFRIIFDFAQRLQNRKHFLGVLAHRHIAWHFFERDGYPHHLTPNGHFIVVTDRPLTIEVGKNIYLLLASLRERRRYGKRLYADLHIEELTSQAEINRWICYIFTPMDFVKPYLSAVKRGVNIESLNYEVDDRVFQCGDVLLSQPSPRRFGLLRSNGKGYVGTMSVTKQRDEEAAQRVAKRQRSKKASDNYLHDKACLQEFIKNEGNSGP